MATIMTVMQIQDNMSPALRSLNATMVIMLNRLEAIKNMCQSIAENSGIDTAENHVEGIEETLNRVEGQLSDIDRIQQDYTRNVRNSAGLMGVLKNAASQIDIVDSLKKVMELSDNMRKTTASINSMNDGLQSTRDLQNQIFQSAQRTRVPFQTTADLVTKLAQGAGSTFKSNSETIAFAENLNKMFMVAGKSQQEAEATSTHLAQVLGTGVVKGRDFTNIFKSAPGVVQAIADHLGMSTDEISKMAEAGALTSDIVKNSMLAATDDINEQFGAMPVTFDQIGTMFQNTILQAAAPILEGIGAIAQFVFDNWSIIEPIFWGLVAAIGVYSAVIGVQAAMTGLNTLMIWLAVDAHRALIRTMRSNPILTIAVVIGVVVGLIYAWIKSVGGLEIAWKLVTNTILLGWDIIKLVFFTGVFKILNIWDKLKLGLMIVGTGIANFMGDMKVKVLMLLQSMVNNAIDIINDFITTLNKIPGVSIETISNVSFGTNADLKNEAEKAAREAELEKYREDIESNISGRNQELMQMETDARNAAAQRQAEVDEMRAKAQSDKQDELKDGIDNTAENTGNMADSMDVSDEEIKYLRDLAEQEVINRFTTAEIKVEMGGITNTVNSETDLDGMVTYLEEKLHETMQVAAEGVHS